MTDLVEIVALAISTADNGRYDDADEVTRWLYNGLAQAAIAAARPVIEAEVREQCAKVAEAQSRPDASFDFNIAIARAAIAIRNRSAENG